MKPFYWIAAVLILAACTTNDAITIDITPTTDALSTVIAQQNNPTTVPTEAPSATLTDTPTLTPTLTPSVTSTDTPTVTPTNTPSATHTLTATHTPTATESSTATPSPTITTSPTLTATQITIGGVGDAEGSPPMAVQAAQATSTVDANGIPTRIPSVVPIPANPSPTQLVISAPTLAPTGVFPTNTPRISPTPTVIPGDHFWFWRPFPPSRGGSTNDFPARGYAYGSTAGGGLQVHHGMDYENPTGTPVQSIGSGHVFYAGTDLQVLFGPQPDFYGNVVVIEHDVLAPDGRPVFSLYGHLSRIQVTEGEEVGFGTVIGSVGAEGVAFGPHLHLEIRLGDPFDYNSTYNPELWVLPWENYGVLAARVTAPDGSLVKGARIELIGRGSYFSGWTYATDTVNADPYLGENIVIGDIRSGQYDLKVGEARAVLYRDVVFVEAGVVTFIEIHLTEFPAPEASPSP